MTETYSEMMHRRLIEYDAHKNDPAPITTSCQNQACPYKIDKTCGHNIFADEMTCRGNDLGHKYVSQKQSIYADYLHKCEQYGDTPMDRFHYFEC